MSQSYVGSSGSVAGASASGATGGSHALTQTILGSVATVGEDTLLGGSSPKLVAPAAATPVSAPAVPAPSSNGITTILILIVVAIVGVFAFRKL